MATTIEKEKSKSMTKKILIICGSIFYIYGVLVYLHAKFLTSQNARVTMLEAIPNSLTRVFTKPIEFFPIVKDSIGMVIGASVLLLCAAFIVITEALLKKHDNPDTVNGDAHFMNMNELKAYNYKYVAPLKTENTDGENNMIISKDIKLAIDNAGTRRNCNILVIGGSGAGKSRFFASPNILQFNCNFVITDPSGEMLRNYGKVLEDNGYEVKVFNLTDVYRSSKYNPFHYIKEEKDVFTLVNTLIQNTTPPEKGGGDPFWEKSENLLLTALILFLWHKYEEPTRENEDAPYHQNFESVMKLLGLAEVDENDASAQSPLDELFLSLEQQDPENLAVSQYKKFKQGAGKTMKSILISIGSRLQSFDLSDIRYLTNRDEFEFERFSDTKQALFVIIPTADTTFNFLVSMLYSQLFSTLYNYAETTAEFGWKLSLDALTNITIVHGENKLDSLKAKKEVEEIAKQIKAGLLTVYDKEKKLYKVYTKDTAKENIKVFDTKGKNVQKEVDLYKKQLSAYIKENQLSAKIYTEEYKEYNQIEIFTRRCEEKLVSVPFVEENAENTVKQYEAYYKEELGKPKIIINKNEKEKCYDIWELPCRLVGWRGTQEDAAALVNQLKGKLDISPCGPVCPNHVRLILDEFANIGQIPNFDEKLATMRKYEISCSIILQALSQLKVLYKDKWNTIVANCDTKLFLGCDDTETIEWILKMLGKKTTKTSNASYQANGGGSTSIGSGSLELMTIDQVTLMKEDECLVRIRGIRPYYGKKYELTNHPRYESAMKTKGSFYIPLNSDAKEKQRGPLRLREEAERKAREAAKHITDEEHNVPEQKNKPRKEEKSASTYNTAVKNNIRKQDAKANEDILKNDMPEDAMATLNGMLSEMGISGRSTDTEIKEAIASIIALDEPPTDVISYALT